MRTATIGVISALLASVVHGQAASDREVALRSLASANQAQNLEAGPPPRSASAKQNPDLPATADRYFGEITGSDVYVRSGAGTSYYPVMKLQRGDRVQVLGQEFGWARIAPPKGCYSLIDQRYVKRIEGDSRRGIVTGQNIRVRAGSPLVNRKYAVQLQLSRNAQVEILGEDKESGFYKIEPPKGAAVFVSAQYVRRAQGPAPVARREPSRTAPPKTTTAKPQRPTARETETALRSQPPKSGSKKTPDSPKAIDRPIERPQSEAPVIAALRTLPESPARDAIIAIETEVAVEFTKSVQTQDMSGFIERLKQTAGQAEEPLAKSYAEQRAERLERWMALLKQVGEIRSKSESLPSQLASYSKPKPDDATPRFDYEGELRKSQIFSRRGLPTYYRLVDPSKRPARTIAYIQLPQGETFNLNRYLGQYIHVRAAEQRHFSTTGRSVPLIIPAAIGVPEPDETTDEPRTANDVAKDVKKQESAK